VKFHNGLLHGRGGLLAVLVRFGLKLGQWSNEEIALYARDDLRTDVFGRMARAELRRREELDR
jgi:hypothetical protein